MNKLKIYITVTEDPLYINPFIRKIIKSCHSEIIGIGITKGSFIEGKNFARKIEYSLTIALISGPLQILKRATLMGSYFAFKLFLGKRNPFSIASTAKKYDIPIDYVDDLNSEEFLNYLRSLSPDIIINQANFILKNEFILIPKKGCINRHSALLPKYRGQLAPFWAYLNSEENSGVSIHFVEEKIDSGDILVQKQVPINRFDTFDTLLNKIFSVTSNAMLEALDIIRNDDFDKIINNDDSLSSYYSAPRFKDAIRYRKIMLKKWLFGI